MDAQCFVRNRTGKKHYASHQATRQQKWHWLIWRFPLSPEEKTQPENIPITTANGQ